MTGKTHLGAVVQMQGHVTVYLANMFYVTYYESIYTVFRYMYRFMS